MTKSRQRYFVGDFETTVYKGQVNTEVWASASVELFTEDVHIFHSIQEQFDYFLSLKTGIVVYYHNLKFDGNFWLSFLMLHTDFKLAATEPKENTSEFTWDDRKDMPNNSYQYLISSTGQWYNIIIKANNKIIEIRDSLKLLPFSVKEIGKAFNTKHQKLEMEYTGVRYAGCTITDEEKEYIANDVLVVKEALEIMINQGHKKTTIGSCCLEEFRKGYEKIDYDKCFPDLYSIPIDEAYGSKTAGDYIRKSYRGGWCYVVKGKEKQMKYNGTTADVNSLYPSMMSSESGNRYPVGEPTFWRGNYIPNIALAEWNYYFVRIRTRFYLKKDKLPFIQLKTSLMYGFTEMLETSDIRDPKTGIYHSSYIDFDGTEKPATVTMTLTMTDYELIKEHYELVDFEILDGCYFKSRVGLFDMYIEKYKKIKLESKGALRTLAKLFLNNLYGKMATSTDSSFKVAYVKEDKSLGFYTVSANDKVPGYIAIGSAITSYARNFTIRAAQKNYYGKDKRGFIYADTDSIHCDLKPEELKGITVHDKNFCCWKLESCWDSAYFVRQKTYIEHITHEDLQPISTPYYNVKCAGMPDKCKNLFLTSMGENAGIDVSACTEEEQEFLSKKRTIEDFNVGLRVPGKLIPKRIRGGVLLVDTYYEMR